MPTWFDHMSNSNKRYVNCLNFDQNSSKLLSKFILRADVIGYYLFVQGLFVICRKPHLSCFKVMHLVVKGIMFQCSNYKIVDTFDFKFHYWMVLNVWSRFLLSIFLVLSESVSHECDACIKWRRYKQTSSPTLITKGTFMDSFIFACVSRWKHGF